MSRKNSTKEKKQKLGARKPVQKRLPRFKRSESWRYKRLKPSWRRPHGVDSKMRLKVRGWPPSATTGHRSPKHSRGLHPSGYQDVLIHSIGELERLNPQIHAARLAGRLGKRKRQLILARSRELEVRVVNP